MESSETELTHAGQAIRRALDGGSDAAGELRDARSRLLDRVASRGAPPPRRAWSRLATARRSALFAGLAAVAVGVALWMRTPISFQVAGATTSGRWGDVVEATATTPLALRFSEGSAIDLDAGARVRVLTTDSTGARVLIENGGMDIAVAHRKAHATRWRFEAGPFRVAVTGTRFRVTWNPGQQAFALGTSEGSVIVSAPCLDHPRTVAAGETLTAVCPRGSDGVEPAAQPASSAITTVVRDPLVPTQATDVGSARTSHSSDSWRDLLSAGRLSEGLRAAERGDFSRVCRVASLKELVALADAARLAGHLGHAHEALTGLRHRYPDAPDAATAAFTLGRIAFERRGAYDEAAHWFATYLEEQPHGPLMGDAVGRLMEARQRSGDRASARMDATRYLLRFPEGPYAPAARVILAD